MGGILMQQFDVFENPSPTSRKSLPFLIILQHDRASETDSVVVAGLTPLSKTSKMAKSRLYPSLNLNGKGYQMITPNMATIRRSLLQKRVANFELDHRKIIDAVDMLFTGI